MIRPAREYRAAVAETRDYGFVARTLRRWLGITDCKSDINDCFDEVDNLRTHIHQRINQATKETNERIDVIRDGHNAQISALSKDLARATSIRDRDNSGPFWNLLTPHRIVTAEETLARFEALEQELGLEYKAPSAAPRPTYSKKEPKV